LQEDKEPVFDAVDTVRTSVRIMSGIIPGIDFHAARMLDAASDRTLAATDIADRLVRQGLPFREAHARTGAMMRPEALQADEGASREPIPSPEDMVEARNHKGGTSRDRVTEQIRDAKSFLKRSKQADAPARRTGAKRGDGEEIR